jgi:hypothetical protein
LTRLTLAERVLAIEDALAGVPHAFGGALALAYYAEPRTTVDIDLNVFVPPEGFGEIADKLDKLGADARAPEVAAAVARDGQARVMWEGTPIDLFFAYDAFHEAAKTARRVVPFADRTIQVLSPEHIIVCKAVFDRPKDWVDIESVLDAGTAVDTAEVLRWVGRLAGDDDHRFDRAAALLSRR